MSKSIKRITFLAVEAIVFVLASWVFFTFVSSVFNAVGSAIDVKPLMLPYWLSVVVLIYFLVAYHLYLFPESEAKLLKTLRVNGIVLGALSFIAALLLIVYVAIGRYNSLVAGNVTPLFPLDFIIFDLAIAGLSVWAAIAGFKNKTPAETVYFPYKYGKVRKVVSSVFRGLWLPFALYFTACFVLNIFIGNYGSSSWWAMLFLWILCGVPAGLAAFREWFYRGKAHSLLEERKTALVCLIVALSSALLMFIGLAVVPNFIVENATGLFLLDYMKSWNAAPYLSTLTAVVPPLVAFISSFKGKKNAAKEETQTETK